MKINLIESSEKNRFSVSEKVVDEIIARKMSDIKILQIDYEKGIDGARIVKITGMAPDRERLLLFRQTLESDQNFSNVDLPISNFVKGKNINFELKITVK